MGKITAY